MLTCYKFCPREFVMATLIFITVPTIFRLIISVIYLSEYLFEDDYDISLPEHNISKSRFQYGGKFLIIKLHLECRLFHEIFIEEENKS